MFKMRPGSCSRYGQVVACSGLTVLSNMTQVIDNFDLAKNDFASNTNQVRFKQNLHKSI
jgi:hypothetical protein